MTHDQLTLLHLRLCREWSGIRRSIGAQFPTQAFGTISPFLIPQSVTDINGNTVLLCPEDTDSVNHGHAAIDAKLDLNTSLVAQNDRYAFVEVPSVLTIGWTNPGVCPSG